MPTYDYECEKCGHRFEKFQSMSDPVLKTCPKCKGKVKRLIGAGAGLLFKGEGFYITDYRSKGYQDKAKSDKAAEGGSSGSKDGGTSDGGKSDSGASGGSGASSGAASNDTSAGGTSKGEKATGAGTTKSSPASKKGRSSGSGKPSN